MNKQKSGMNRMLPPSSSGELNMGVPTNLAEELQKKRYIILREHKRQSERWNLNSANMMKG